jgi:hypothetical protein
LFFFPRVCPPGTSIGKRYARTDEVGIPFAITVEHDTHRHGEVTLRDRDTCAQIRLPATEVASLVKQLCDGRIAFSNLLTRFKVETTGEDKAAAAGGAAAGAGAGAGSAAGSTAAAAAATRASPASVSVEGVGRASGRFSRPKTAIL